MGKEIIVGYLTNNSQLSWNAFKERARIAQSKGVALAFIPSTRQTLRELEKNNSINSKFWLNSHMSQKEIKIPPVIYDRTNLSRTPKLRSELIRFFENENSHFVNSPLFRQICSDKWNLVELLEDSKCNVPYTQIYSPDSLEEMIEITSGRIFIKKRTASQGKSQFVVKKTHSKNQFLYATSEKPEQTYEARNLSALVKGLHLLGADSGYIIQQGINADTFDSRVFDYRVIVQKGLDGKNRMTCFYMRIGPVKSEQANISKKGHPQDPFAVFTDYQSLERRMRKESQKIMQSISKYNPGEVGIDFLQDDDGQLSVLEINSKPGSKGIRTLREWNPTERKYAAIKAIPYEYTDQIRQRWGRRLNRFLSNPMQYAKYLVDTHANE
ncbi:MAG: YheC/YheD family protein [bacterium]